MAVVNETVQALWPVEMNGEMLPHAQFVSDARAWLDQRGVPTLGFSHLGIVVRDLDATVKLLAARVDPAWAAIEAVWGEAYGCRVARRVQNDTEYEFIEPIRASFLRAFLDQNGPGVQHLSFEVANLTRALDLLRRRGVPLAGPGVRQGLHGLIAFVTPGPWGARCFELCQVVSSGGKA